MGQMTHQQRQTAQAVIWVNRTVPPMRAVWGPRQQQFPGDAAAHAFIEGLPAIQGCVCTLLVYVILTNHILFDLQYFFCAVSYDILYVKYKIIYHVFHIV